MKLKIILLVLFAIHLSCLAQSQLPREYSYDEAGNRTGCKVIEILHAPPAFPKDSTETDEPQIASNELPEEAAKYFVEKMAQIEIKIYPNPATEKITLEFSGLVAVENIRPLRLYSLSGQFLQEQPVHSAVTEVPLAGLARGTYILKLQINGQTESWKVVKN